MQRAILEESVSELSVGELESLVRRTEPRALLTAPRVLRRVILQDRNLGALRLNVTHRKSHILPGERLKELVSPDEVGLATADDMPEMVLLITRPSDEELPFRSDERWLAKYWRLLFHGRIHLDLLAKQGAGRLDDTLVRSRICALGKTAFDEASLVLRQEGYLAWECSEVDAYIEFASVYCEIHAFAPALTGAYFPSLANADAVLSVLAADLDVPAIYSQTRPPGAKPPHPFVLHAPAAYTPLSTTSEPENQEPGKPSRLMRAANRCAAAGNHVRAAKLRWMASESQRGAAAAQEYRNAALADLTQLVQRLRAVIHFDAQQDDEWIELLSGLMPRAAHGFWTRESRFLYDLQKLCNEQENEVFSLDVWAWIAAGFSRPLKQPLPGLAQARVCQHLKNALAHLRACDGQGLTAERLRRLLEPAFDSAEHGVRTRFRPVLREAFHGVGIRPQDPTSQVALNKIVEELLDRLTENGFLAMADLRDAISRNQIKLSDVDELNEVVRGDQLLQADRALVKQAAGVYHGGEVYLRWPQTFSSLAFGTPAGRWLVKFVGIPFGGAYVALEGLNHLLMAISAPFWGHGIHFNAFPPTIVVGLFLLNFIYQEDFRRFLYDSAKLPINAARFALTVLPGVLAKLPFIQMLRNHPLVKICIPALMTLMLHMRSVWRYVVKPGLVTFVLWLLLQHYSPTIASNASSVNANGQHEQTSSRGETEAHAHPAAEPSSSAARKQVDVQNQAQSGNGLQTKLDKSDSLAAGKPSNTKPVHIESKDSTFLLPFGSLEEAASAALDVNKAPAAKHAEGPVSSWYIILSLFFAANLVLNSGFGRDLGEMTAEWLARRWKDFRVHVIAGLFRAVVDFFSKVVDALDRLLYSVDEMLRFRSGQGPLRMFVKAILGSLWSVIRYFIRIYVTLLVEPQVNPVKHFPVVTVSHKFIVPFYPQINATFKVALMWFFAGLLGMPNAWATVLWVVISVPTIFLLPGVFGFLAWELKENWRLFEANRSQQLKPTPVGSHGETVIGLLRPGLNSGTLPRLYARLRRTERRAMRGEDPRLTHEIIHRLEHVRRDIVRFVERELVELLLQSEAWGRLPLHMGDVVTSPNRISVSLLLTGSESAFRFSWWEDSGWLFAKVEDPGWLRDVSAAKQRLFATALMGLYKLSGVDIVQEQLVDELGYEPAMVDVAEQELLIYKDIKKEPLRYSLHTETQLLTHGKDGAATAAPPLERGAVILSSRPILWPKWKEVWDENLSLPGAQGGLLSDWRVLPASIS